MHDIHWVDIGRKAQHPPDPRYPKGIDLDVTKPGEDYCPVEVPYPAKGCGYFQIMCQACGSNIIITTAGRPDDPRSVKVPCRKRFGNK
jgi:hypothetical protein